jgi:monovalent cation:H+ antiporter-2, CPA2 family
MILEFLYSLVLIFGISALILFMLGKLKIPSIVGFLVAGVLMGPYGFDLLKDVHEIELLAEIGVVLLMFTIGLEFSLKNLLMLRNVVFGGGLLQVCLTIVVVAFLSYFYLAQTFNGALFDGFLVALSSTAIVFKMLLDRAEMNAPYGKAATGMLIFQDLCVVPFMLLVPALGGNSGGAVEIMLTLIKATLVVIAVLFSAKWAVPRILHQIVSTRSRELFVITIIVVSLGTALLTSKLGLSLALGAFLAGVVISESEYAAQAVSDILPFKESFTGLFFIAIGMLMNLGTFLNNIVTVVTVVAAILLIKISVTSLATFVLGQSLRNALQTGFYLAQIGEFSFVLVVAGKAHGLISEELYQTFLSASILTMILTPFAIGASSRISNWLVSKPGLRGLERLHRDYARQRYPDKVADHVIVIGFGLNGSNLSRVLKASGIPYVVLELNSATVRQAKRKGEPIYYGDGASAEILHRLGIKTAKTVVVAISDAAVTRRIVQIARAENTNIYIIVRTRYLAEVDDLVSLGANEVIPEEFETSIEIFSKVLRHYYVPVNVISEHIEAVRRESYRALRSVALPRKPLADKYELLRDIEIETYLVKGGSPGEGRLLGELGLRTKAGVTVLVVERVNKAHTMPSGSFRLEAGDILLMIGKRDDIHRALAYLETGLLPRRNT